MLCLLTHRRQVAAASVLYKMHAKLCPKDLNEMLPLPLERRRVTRASTSASHHAVSIPAAKTYQLDRSFIHTASKVWNSLPDHVVGTISQMGLESFKSRVHTCTVVSVSFFKNGNIKSGVRLITSMQNPHLSLASHGTECYSFPGLFATFIINVIRSQRLP